MGYLSDDEYNRRRQERDSREKARRDERERVRQYDSGMALGGTVINQIPEYLSDLAQHYIDESNRTEFAKGYDAFKRGITGQAYQTPDAAQRLAQARSAQNAAAQQNKPAPAGQQTKPSLGDNAKPAMAPAAPAAAPQSNVRSWSWGEFGQPGSGTATYHGRTLPAPGSNFRNYGYDPAEAQQVQASPNYRQIGANTYMTNRGLMIQGDEGVADYFSRFQHAPSTPIWTPAPQRQAAPQPQMPEAPQGGWKTRRAVYQAQMDAYNKALDRQRAMDIAQRQDARAAERFGFDQEQARQAMDLQRAQLGLHADQNVWNRAKAMSDMEQAAVGRQLQQIQLGAQQEYLRALQSGDPAAISRAEAALQALNPKGRGRGGAKDAGGTKVQNLKIGEEEIPFSVDNNGNATLVMPEVMEFYAQNRDKFPESVQGQPLYHQLGRMMPGYREWKVRQEREAAKAKK